MKFDSEKRAALWFTLPLLLIVAAFILIPVIGTVATSFMRDVTFLPERFIGLANYSSLWHDGAFWQALRFTSLFTLVAVPVELVCGLGFALILHQHLPGRALLRVAVLIPWAIPAVISGRAFELIYHYSYGLANFMVQGIGLSADPVNWLGSGWGAFFSIVIADAWKTTPFVAIILLAGLSAIPEELYQQATVDRAHFLQTFRLVTLPLLKPVLLVALLFRTVDTLRIFDVIYVLTGGGPGGATNALSLYSYQYYVAGDFGYGSAISFVLFVIALVFSLFYVRASRFLEEMQ